ncbi:uncharacterized protein LOC142552050 [Primulina tabacum]|uniref:uncharacterized protein LOC142552050 n=1 Tax=Primulina tabacum TaxID=48773 RepID=UPI003F59F3D1
MDLGLTSGASAEAGENGGILEQKVEENEPPAYASMVDSFLIEALRNPRHRLTVLRMEIDIQKFIQNSDLHKFEFQHFPTSYLRLAAHRVAQHYGLHTMVQDNVVDGRGMRILVLKKPESKFPAFCLSDVPAKDSETDYLDQIKIVIRPRSSKLNSNDAKESEHKRNPVRTVEERKEEYDRARARIFSSQANPESKDALFQAADVESNLNVDDNEVLRNLCVQGDNRVCSREFSTSTVATFRDREKDRIDPDYDRSYERYVRNTPSTQNFIQAQFNVQKIQPPFVQYESLHPRLAHMRVPLAALNYENPVMNHYCAAGLSQKYGDALYMQWPMQTMMYTHSYDQLRHNFFQEPFSQQPLSFDYSQNR